MTCVEEHGEPPLLMPSSSPLLEHRSQQRGRTLNWIHVAAIAFYCVGGPFGFEESLDATKNPALSFWALIAMALFWALPQSMLIAELSTLYNHGYTEWVVAGLGAVLGTAHGWIRSVCNVATNITYAALFADYFLDTVFGVSSASAASSYWVWVLMRLAAVVPYVGVILLGNLLGVRLVGWASVAFTLLVIAPFAAMFSLAAPMINLSVLLDFSLYQASSMSVSYSSSPWSAITNAKWNLLVGVLIFNLIGWDDVGNLATRVRKIKRDMPVGIVVCLVLVLVTYIAPLLSIAATMTPLEYGVDMYEESCRRLWHPLGTIMSVDALLGIFGLGFVYMTTSSEAQAHCSALGLFPTVLGRRTHHGNSPWVAMCIQACVMFVVTPFSSFSIAVEVQSWLYTLSVAVIGISFLSLRWRNRKTPPRKNTFHIPLPFGVLVLCAIPMLLLCIACLVLSSWTTLAVCPAFAVLLVGLSWLLHHRGVLRPTRLYDRLATAPPEECPQVPATTSVGGGLCVGVIASPTPSPQSPSVPPSATSSSSPPPAPPAADSEQSDHLPSPEPSEPPPPDVGTLT